MSRRDLNAMLHLGAKRLGMDEPTRRDWMEKHTGKRSAKDCTDAELSLLCDRLRGAGALDDGRPLGRSDAGSDGLNQPTRKQLLKLKVLCKRRGFKGGLDDSSYITFVRRIAKVDHPRFLTQDGARKVIIALQSWIEHDRKKEQGA